MKVSFALVCVSALLAGGARAESAAAVIPLAGEDAAGIAEALRVELAKDPRFVVLPEEDTRAKLTTAADLGLTCASGDVPCAAKLGVLAELAYLVLPVLGTGAEGATLEVILVEVATGSALGRAKRPLGFGDPKAIATDALAEVLNPDGYRGYLIVAVAEAGAQVFVDGAPVGTSPLEAPIEVRPGQHEVVVEREGQPPFKTTATVRYLEQVTVEVDPAGVAAETGEGGTSPLLDVALNPLVLAAAGVTALGAVTFVAVGVPSLVLEGIVRNYPYEQPFGVQGAWDSDLRNSLFWPTVALQMVARLGFLVMVAGAVTTISIAAFVAYSE